MTEYDIGKAFEAIENELMASMIRNIEKHRAWEEDEGIQWEQWQTMQLQALEKYKKANQKRFSGQFKDINKELGVLIREARQQGNMQQEIAILNAIKKGFPAKKITKGASAEFFKLNDRKLEALIKATTQDMEKAETAVLRMANDQYRKIIFNAQVYANTGAGTYEKAVDMATKDFLSAGLNCVEYANGARHTLADYADMAIRTASKRAYLQGEGEKRQEWGISTVIMNKRGNPCPKCLPFVGKVLIDDVWSGGPADGKSPETGIRYPLMSKAIAAGLYHPRCKDSHTTYFEGISTPPDDKYTQEELNELSEQHWKESKLQYAVRQVRKFERLSEYSLDDENREEYQLKADKWNETLSEINNDNIAKIENSDIIKSGAVSGARNPYSDEAKEHARKYYGLVRSMKTDVKKIADTTGYSEEQIQDVKNFIFMDKHDLGGKELEYFEPDYMMGESWKRLIEGKPEPHDITLLNHEIMEKNLIRQGLTQQEAHILTSQKYNYDKEATEFYDKIKKFKKK